MTKAELVERLAELEARLEDMAREVDVLLALGSPHIASSDVGKPVSISFQDGDCGVLVYPQGATFFVDTETVGAVGSIPADVLMEELKWAGR